MSNFIRAVEIICKYENFSEKAYADPVTNDMPYTIGYGTQFYPDGSPVKKGQCCTREKALEYLKDEIECIVYDLENLNIHIDEAMREALISFIHSVGWKPFLYSAIIDCIENEDWSGVVEEMSQWVFDHYHDILGNLLERRREETKLFLELITDYPLYGTDILLEAFRNYDANPSQIESIRNLENNINPYALAEFASAYRIFDHSWTTWY